LFELQEVGNELASVLAIAAVALPTLFLLM